MIAPAQTQNLQVKPRWVAPVGVMESVVAYNCRKYGMPRPVLAMPMWEGAGNQAIDLSGYGNHGSLQSTTSWVAEGTDFNGTSDYISIPTSNLILPTDSSHTACCWVKMPNVTDAERRIFFESANADYTISLGWGNDGVYGRNNKFQAFTNSSIGPEPKYANSTTSPVANQWYFVCTQVNSVTNRVYIFVNGILEAQSATFSGTINNSAGLNIGTYRNADGRWMQGIINNVQIFNTVLTTAQAKFLYGNPYFMYRLPEELYGYPPAVVGAIMNQFQKCNIGADLYNGAIIA